MAFSKDPICKLDKPAMLCIKPAINLAKEVSLFYRAYHSACKLFVKFRGAFAQCPYNLSSSNPNYAVRPCKASWCKYAVHIGSSYFDAVFIAFVFPSLSNNCLYHPIPSPLSHAPQCQALFTLVYLMLSSVPIAFFIFSKEVLQFSKYTCSSAAPKSGSSASGGIVKQYLCSFLSIIPRFFSSSVW